MARSSRPSTESYLTYLLESNVPAVVGLFAAEPAIEDPIAGTISGTEAVADFARGREQWLAARAATVEHLRTTHVPARTVVEYVLHLDLHGERTPLPYAIVGEHGPDDSLQQIRAYHSMRPLLGRHEVREAILPAREDLELRDVIATYQQALAEGDVETIVGTFEPDGYFREPAGGAHFHSGTEALTEFMAQILRPGGITLEHCTVSDDGVACAIEFNAVVFGDEPLIPQAGVAVYERGSSGLLHAARIYDDVNVEALAGSE